VGILALQRGEDVNIVLSLGDFISETVTPTVFMLGLFASIYFSSNKRQKTEHQEAKLN